MWLHFGSMCGAVHGARETVEKFEINCISANYVFATPAVYKHPDHIEGLALEFLFGKMPGPFPTPLRMDHCWLCVVVVARVSTIF